MTLISEVQKALSQQFSQANDQMEFLDERGDGHHFLVRIISDQFAEKSRIERSRMVYQLLNNFLKTDRIHALRMELKTHQENG